MIRTLESIETLKDHCFSDRFSSLAALLEPKTIAVFGATQEAGTVGNSLLKNLLNTPFYGHVFPISAAEESIFDVPVYTSIRTVPDRVDLALIATPISIVPSILEDCVAAGVKSAIVISPGFRESGAIGRSLEQQLRDRLSLGSMRLLGPNSLGVMNPRKGLNATLSSTVARPGNMAFISQSGALCRAVLDWSFHENVGFSAFVSMGSMLDIGWGDLIAYLGDDPYTQSIVIHMEAVGDAKAFLAAAREVAPLKPIIVLKGGRTEAAVQAAIAHTSGVMGSDDVFEAALRRCGVLQVNRISELFNMAEVLAKRQWVPHGNRLTIVTNSGGLGVLATDALIATGGQLAPLTPATMTQLDEALPSDWSRSNPIDILGDADGDRFQRAIAIAANDPNTDGLLVIFAPQGVADPTDTAERLKDWVNQRHGTQQRQPILASWVGGADVLAGESILNRYQIPTYAYPDSAARLFNLMWQHSQCLQGLAETPTLPPQWAGGGPHRAVVAKVIDEVQKDQRTTLSVMETATLLTAYGLPMIEMHLANHADQAVAIARQMGYPLIVKPGWAAAAALNPAAKLAHDATSLCDAYRVLTDNRVGTSIVLQPVVDLDGTYEVMLRSEIDAQFGPIVRFGGGPGWSHLVQHHEYQRHQAVALPPLNEALAQQLIDQTRVGAALQGPSGALAVDLTALKTLIVRFAQLVAEQPQIQSIQLHPVLIRPVAVSAKQRQNNSPNGLDIVILSAHIELHGGDRPLETLPRPLLRPYPEQYVSTHTLADGTPLTLRPIRPQDEPLLMSWQAALAASTAKATQMPQTLAGHLSPYDSRTPIQRLCYRDYDEGLTLVAEMPQPTTRQPTIKGMARLCKRPAALSGQGMVEIDPAYQTGNLEAIMLQQLLAVARQEGVQRLAIAIAHSPALAAACAGAGFTLHADNGQSLATLALP